MSQEEFPDWFALNGTANFTEHLMPLAGKPDLRFLQIGVFVGNASKWLIDNVLTDPTSLLDDVDGWSGSEDLEDVDFGAVERAYDLNLAAALADGRIAKHHQLSGDFLASMPRESIYDFIYIDGDHTAFGTLCDAVNTWPLLKVGGILAFDDYTWQSGLGATHDPDTAINAFGACIADRIDILAVNTQCWARKIR